MAAVLREGDLAIDATAGNGHDTLFLAQQVGTTGRVIAFDIQEEAIQFTRTRVAAAGLLDRVVLIRTSHAMLAQQVEPGTVAAVMFNLGYLPGGDVSLITHREETLAALVQALVALRPTGLLSIVCYPGHPGGDEESAAVLDWAAGLDAASWAVEVERREDTLRPAPFLVLVRRLG